MSDYYTLSDSPSSALDAYYEEFPFLREIVPRVQARAARVERIDLELLDLVPQDDSVVQSGRDIHLAYLVFSSDMAGGTVFRYHKVRFTHRYREKKRSLLRPSTWFGEVRQGDSVREALIALGETSRNLSYVVLVTRPRHASIRIFKVPKDFDLQNWIREEQEKLRSRMRDA